uniref:Octanoyl-[acyl-carrier-protein]:protein N-octanoyltransferase LIPT2, mitochondrial n=1 Tax=Sinocyclocheilus grahami TaxID=75366 RepID=A0A672L2K0_SINGR
MTVTRAAVKVVRLGRISYRSALKVQQQHIKQHLDSSSCSPNTLLLCEHEPVYTVGIRRAPYPPEEEQRLKALGADFFRTNRGGLITFHGPGQLVCYPVLNLACFKKSVRWYVCELERTVIKMCSQFGIEASTSPDTGVWVGDNKILLIFCFAGIHCGRYVTSHGLLGRDVPTEEAVPKLLDAFTEQFNCTLIYN